MTDISVAEAKSHLSEYIARSGHGRERFVISRRGKPVAALVSVEDLRIIEQHEEQQGLAAIAGAWPDFNEVEAGLGDLGRLRQSGGGGRDVSF